MKVLLGHWNQFQWAVGLCTLEARAQDEGDCSLPIQDSQEASKREGPLVHGAHPSIFSSSM